MPSREETISWTDYRGRRITHEVNQLIDIRDFVGMPGYALLVLAANSNPPNHLTAPAVQLYLKSKGGGANRSLSNLKKRRWLFRPPGTNNYANHDGQDARAFEIMATRPELSVRNLVVALKDRGIKRGREWVRIHRSDGM